VLFRRLTNGTAPRSQRAGGDDGENGASKRRERKRRIPHALFVAPSATIGVTFSDIRSVSGWHGYAALQRDDNLRIQHRQPAVRGHEARTVLVNSIKQGTSIPSRVVVNWTEELKGVPLT
jgi:hypothetical protein